MPKKAEKGKKAPELYWASTDIARFLNITTKTVVKYAEEGRFGSFVRLPSNDIRIANTAYVEFLRTQEEEHKYVDSI